MELLTSSEISKKWGISSRRVSTLCKEGRVKGALLKGNVWLIPQNTPKPDEKIRGRKKKEN